VTGKYIDSDLEPRENDKVKWKRAGNNTYNKWAKGIVSHMIGEDVYVYVPNMNSRTSLKSKYKKRADQLILLERPQEVDIDLSSL